MTAPDVKLTHLEARIMRCYTQLRRARFDGSELMIEIAERDLNDQLDLLPRKTTP